MLGKLVEQADTALLPIKLNPFEHTTFFPNNILKMGTGQSTHATMEITGGSPYGDSLPRSVSGRKQSSAELDPQANTVISEQDEIVQPSVISDDDSIEEADDYDSDEGKQFLALFVDKIPRPRLQPGNQG